MRFNLMLDPNMQYNSTLTLVVGAREWTPGTYQVHDHDRPERALLVHVSSGKPGQRAVTFEG